MNETIEVNCEATTSIRSVLKSDECDISCDFVNMENHKEEMHSKGMLKIGCDECDMKTKNVAEFNAHKNEKHKEHLSCDQCELTFISREKLGKHMCRLHIVNPT